MDPQIKALIDSINSLVKEMKESTGPDKAQTRAGIKEMEREDLKERNEQLKVAIKASDDENESLRLKNELLANQNRLTQLSNKSSDKKAAAIAKVNKRIKSNNELIEKNTKAQEELDGALEETIQGFSGLADVSKKAGKSLSESARETLKSEEAQKELGKRLKSNYGVVKSFGKAVGKLLPFVSAQFQASFLEIDQGVASFNQATAMADMFGKNLISTSSEMREFGVTVGDVGNALATLGQAYPLNILGEGATKIAGKFALYEKFGISVQASSAAFTDLTRSLGRSNDEAVTSISNIGELGRQLGMGAGALVEDFSQAMPRLAIYGNQAEKIFRNVATTSAKLGLSTSDILDLAEGFQTFEGSAQAAGKLNAILGGGFIDNLELMEASFENPAEAAMMIKDAFAATGTSLSSMGPAAIKAAASAAGFSDANKFRRFIEGEISATEALGDDQKNLQLNANKIAQRSQDSLKKIQDALAHKIQNKLDDLPLRISEALGGMSTEGRIGAGAVGMVGGTVAGGIGTSLLGSGLGTGLLAKGAKKILGKGGGQSGFIGPIQQSGPGMFSKMGKNMGNFGKVGGKLLKGGGVLGGIAATATDLYDLSQGDTSAGNLGALAGSVVGGAIGLIGGPAGVAIGAGIGNMIGESVGEYFDSSMPQKQVKQKAAEAGTKNVVEHKHVVEIVQNTPNAERFVKAVYRADLSS